MTGKELWDYMSAIQGAMEPGSAASYAWNDLPDQVKYVWVKAALGLELNGKVVNGVLQ